MKRYEVHFALQAALDSLDELPDEVDIAEQTFVFHENGQEDVYLQVIVLPADQNIFERK